MTESECGATRWSRLDPLWLTKGTKSAHTGKHTTPPPTTICYLTMRLEKLLFELNSICTRRTRQTNKQRLTAMVAFLKKQMTANRVKKRMEKQTAKNEN